MPCVFAGKRQRRRAGLAGQAECLFLANSVFVSPVALTSGLKPPSFSSAYETRTSDPKSNLHDMPGHPSQLECHSSLCSII